MRRPGGWVPLGLLLGVVDALAVLAIATSAGLLGHAHGHGQPARIAVLVAVLVAVGFAHAAQLHRPRLVLSLLGDLPALVATGLVATLALAVAGSALGARLVPGWEAGALFALGTCALLVLLHAATYAMAGLLRLAGVTTTPLLVVGTGSVARRLSLTLLGHPEHGLEPVGFVEADPTGDAPSGVTSGATDGATGGATGARRGLPLPLVGDIGSLPGALARAEVRTIVLALPAAPDEAEAGAVEACLAGGIAVYAAPRYVELARHRLQYPREVVGEISVVRLHGRGARAVTRAARGVASAVVAAVSLVLLAPVLLVLATLVRLETGPGVIVRQPLVDEAGRAEMVPKFRTRRGTLVGDDTTRWQIGNEGRVGPVGRFLRRTRLDELPQVMRVLTAQLWVFPIRTPRPRPRTPLEELPSAAPTGDQAKVDAGQLAG